jgi:DNA-binding transcriptional MocR family regulator
MTPTDEATFIALWEQGASYRELAAALHCPLGTVASRSAALAAQGKIQPRQRGGAYPSRRTKARQPLALSDTSKLGPVHTPVQNPVQTSAPPPLARCIHRCIRLPTMRHRCQTSLASSTPWSSAFPPSKRP